MGIVSFLKIVAPLSLYFLGVAGFFAGLIGRVQITLLLVTLLLPLRNVIEKMQEFPLGGQYLDLLLFSMLIGWVVSSSGRKAFMEKSPLNAISFVLVAYTILSLLIGNLTMTGSIFEMQLSDSRVQDCKNFCLLPLLFLITFNNIRDKKWVWRIFAMMCFSILFVAYYTTSQIAMYSSLASREKISGTFQFLGPNEVAAFMNQCSLILLGVYFCMKKSRNKLILLAIILINIYCITFLYSRAAYIGLATGLLLLFAIKKRFMLIPLFLVAVLWQAVLPEKVVERIKSTKNEYGELDESSEMRVEIWEIALQHFRESPVVGIGYGVFRNLGLILQDTHNIYVKILAEQGIIGLMIFLSVIGTFIKEGFTLYQKGDEDISKGLGLGMMACMFCLLVNNFFGDRWSYFELSGFLWIFAGLIARLNQLSSDPSSAPMTTKSSLGMQANIKRKPKPSYYK